jgi:hypothetical protein
MSGALREPRLSRGTQPIQQRGGGYSRRGGASSPCAELQERNTRSGFTRSANAAAGYGFYDEKKVGTLEIHVMSLDRSPGDGPASGRAPVQDLQ